MIKIDKGEAPPTLAAAEIGLIAAFGENYDNNPQAYIDGQQFTITRQYASDPVKRRLKLKQYGKCCFSEAKFNGDYPDVEHFRPKGRVDIYGTDQQLYPGYYWLAYAWSNLYYCKSVINGTYKRNFFPLYDETQRNRSHHDTYNEQPKLIDPGAEDPRDHIRFHEDEIIHITNRGDFNIKILGLRDFAFSSARNRLFKLLKLAKNAVEALIKDGHDPHSPQVAPLIEQLRESIQPDAEFSSMAIDLLQDWPHFQ